MRKFSKILAVFILMIALTMGMLVVVATYPEETFLTVALASFGAGIFVIAYEIVDNYWR